MMTRNKRLKNIGVGGLAAIRLVLALYGLAVLVLLLVACSLLDQSPIPCLQCITVVDWQFLQQNHRGAPSVAGTAKNDCPYSLGYVQLLARFHDADDIEVGVYWDIMAGLLPGEEWSFEIECPISSVWPFVDHATIEIRECTAAAR